jgi:hypothetical protein
MTDQIYKDTLEAARDEMDSLLREEAEINSRLSVIRQRTEVLRKTIISIGDLLGEDREPETVGITDAIRKVLKGKIEAFFSPIGVRVHLKNSGFPLDSYKNVLAVIHTTLKRLEDQGEVEVMHDNNRTLYRWNEAAIRDEDIPF